jgi:hypothetical protein
MPKQCHNYRVADRQDGGSAGVAEGINDFWRFMILEDNEKVIALVHGKTIADSIIDNLNDSNGCD